MKTRVTGPSNSYYHVFSRVIERRFYLGDEDKEAFCALLWRVAEFSGVNILTYCIMDNHFHILVQIPGKIHITDDELLRRLRILYGAGFRRKGPYDPVREFINSRNDPVLRDRLRQKYLRRMYDLSEFMRTLKLRFSFWYNRTHDREGTLWDARFRSVLIEGTSAKSTGNLMLATVAAYIDLNCVRAGIVEDPKDYRWCGYAEAIAGGRGIRKGIVSMYNCQSPEEKAPWHEVAEVYRSMLCVTANIDAAATISVVNLLRCKVRYFTRGAVLGSKPFVENAFLNHRWMFSNSRKTGARKIKGTKGQNMYAARNVGIN